MHSSSVRVLCWVFVGTVDVLFFLLARLTELLFALFCVDTVSMTLESASPRLPSPTPQFILRYDPGLTDRESLFLSPSRSNIQLERSLSAVFFHFNTNRVIEALLEPTNGTLNAPQRHLSSRILAMISAGVRFDSTLARNGRLGLDVDILHIVFY